MQAILTYQEDLFSGEVTDHATLNIEVCSDFWSKMPEVNDFITREFRKYMQKHDRMIAPYQIKITPDWLRGRVKIKITEIDMECAFSKRLVNFIREVNSK